MVHLMVEDAGGEAERDIRALSDRCAMAVRAADAECEAGSPSVTCLRASSRACSSERKRKRWSCQP